VLVVKITAQKPSPSRTTELIRYLNSRLYSNQKVFQALKLMHSQKWLQPTAIYVPRKARSTNTVTHEPREKTNPTSCSLCFRLLWFLATACVMQTERRMPQTHCQAVQTGFILFSLLVLCLSPFWQQSSPT